jgi:hypothetical protein
MVSDSHFSYASTMSDEEIAFFRMHLAKSNRYLEFGSGFSTIEANKLVRSEIVTVETSLDYITFLKEHLSNTSTEYSKITFVHIEVGETKEWGYPANHSFITEWPKYSLAGINRYFDRNEKPDLVLIDGRFRVATFVILYMTSPGLKVIFDDYNNRPQYHVIEKLLKPSKSLGRIAFFRIPRHQRVSKASLALEILSQFILDPQ